VDGVRTGSYTLLRIAQHPLTDSLQALSWAMTVTWTVYSSLGGTSYAPMAPEQAVTVARLNWISQAWCIAGLMFGKLAVATLILRLQAPAKWRTIAIWTMCIILVLYDLIQITLVFVQCHPVEALWNPAVKGECWSPWIVVDNAIAVSGKSLVPGRGTSLTPLQLTWPLWIWPSPSSRCT
jgi:hypothetical protein